jgi:hypothetical protein
MTTTIEKAMATEGQAFAALPPEPLILAVGGDQLEITPLRIGELPGFARAVKPIAAHLTLQPDWMLILGEDGEVLILALALACRRPPEWLAALSLDEAIQVAEAVFEVNADFFIQRVVPQLQRVSQRLGSLKLGPIVSSDSSAPATTTTTS